MSLTSSLELKLYTENQDSLVVGAPEPNARSQALVFHSNQHKWWIKVTFIGTVSPKMKRERRQEYQELIRLIDYASLHLLDDMVTELVLEEGPEINSSLKIKYETNTTNRFAKLARNMSYRIQEDPLRVTYPSSLEYPYFENIDMRELTVEEEIANGVCRVFHGSDRKPYILNINRPLYLPGGTDVIRKELENLHYFRSVPNIV